METLPSEIIEEIAMNLSLEDLESFMQTNRYFHETLRSNIMWLKVYNKHFQDYFRFESEENKYNWKYLFRKCHIQKNWKNHKYNLRTYQGAGKVQYVCTDGSDIIVLVLIDDVSFNYQVNSYDENFNLIESFFVGDLIDHNPISNMFCVNGYIFLISFFYVFVLSRNPLSVYRTFKFKNHFLHWITSNQYMIASETIENVDRMMAINMINQKQYYADIAGKAIGAVNEFLFVKEENVKCYILPNFELKYEIELEHTKSEICIHEKYVTIVWKKKIILYDTRSGKLVRSLEPNGNEILCASTSVSGKYHFSKFFGGKIHIFNEYGREVSVLPIDPAFQSLYFLYDNFIYQKSNVQPRGYQSSICRLDILKASNDGAEQIIRVQNNHNIPLHIEADKSRLFIPFNRSNFTFTLDILKFDCKYKNC